MYAHGRSRIRRTTKALRGIVASPSCGEWKLQGPRTVRQHSRLQARACGNLAMSNVLSLLPKAFLVSTVLVAQAYAQSLRGSIGGEVIDQARRPLAGASVTLVQDETNKKRTTVSGAQGEFLLILLAPGTYRLQV